MDSEDLVRMRKKCIESLNSCVDNVLKYLKDNEKDAEIRELKECMRGYCALGQIDSLDNIPSYPMEKNDEEYYSEEEISRVVTLCCDTLDQENHSDMKKFMEKINNNTVQVFSQYSDVEVIAEKQTFTDPFTQKPIKEAVRNTHCGHYYEKNTIYNYINGCRKPIYCPRVGCTNKIPLSPEYLLFDEELTQKIAQKLSEDQYDAEEII